MKNTRLPLTHVLHEAWNVVINKHCTNRGKSPDVNTEAALQAYYFNEIRQQLGFAESCGEIDPGIRIFVEPNFRVDGEIITPDLVVCRNSRVICVIELKYFPRFTGDSEKKIPSGFKKDKNNLKKLHAACDEDKSPEFIHDRYVKSEGQQYETFKISRKALFVWAGIYSAMNHDATNLIEFEESRSGSDIPLLQIHTVLNGKGLPFTKVLFE